MPLLFTELHFTGYHRRYSNCSTTVPIRGRWTTMVILRSTSLIKRVTRESNGSWSAARPLHRADSRPPRCKRPAGRSLRRRKRPRLSRNSTTGNFILENTWQDAGGGPSQVEPRPAYQRDVAYIVGGTRGTPDLSFDANPNTGVWVFNDNPVLGDGWFIVGGTSLAAPSLAGITNAAGHFSKSSTAENSALYSGEQRRFNDIVFGDCGLNISDFALPGYDFCTGNGSVNGGKGDKHF